MNARDDERAGIAALLSYVAAALFLSMMCLMLATGISQHGLESFGSPDVYTRRLLEADGALQWLVTLDGAFIATYVASAVYVSRLPILSEQWLAPFFAIGAIIAGFLDVVENGHLIAMLAQARVGVELSSVSIEVQATVSATKWAVAHLSFFTLGLAMDARGWTRVLRWSLLVGQLPLGAAVWAFDGPALLVIARAVSLASGFVLIGLWLRSDETQRARRALLQ